MRNYEIVIKKYPNEMSGDILFKQGRMSQGDNHMLLFNSNIVVGFHSFIHSFIQSSFSFMRVLICIG